MRETLARGPVTDALLAHLRALGRPVGDADIPDGSGWPAGGPSPTSVFRVFYVLVPAPASVVEPALSYTESDWRLPYVLTSHALSRSAVEDIADEARAQLVSLPDATAGQWRVHHVGTAAIGAPVRYQGVEPKIWAQTDTVQVWLTKEEY